MKMFEDLICLNVCIFTFSFFLDFILVSVKIKNAIFILGFNYFILLDLNINLL